MTTKIEIELSDKSMDVKNFNGLLAGQMTIMRDLQKNYIGIKGAEETKAHAKSELKKRINFTGNASDETKEKALNYLTLDVVSKALGNKGLYADGGGVGFDQYGNPYGFDNEMDSVYEFHYKEEDKKNPYKVWDKIEGVYVAEFPSRQRAIEYIERNRLENGGETDDDDNEEDENETRLQELADEYSIPTEVIEEYANDRGIEIKEIDDLPYNGRYNSEEDYAEQMVDEGVITDLSYYLEMTALDKRLLAQEEADRRVDDLDDDDLLREADMEDEANEYSETRDEITDLKEEIRDLETELDDLFEDEDEDTTEGELQEKEERAKELRDELQDKENDLDNLEDRLASIDTYDEVVNKAREELREQYYDDIYEALDKDAVGYFVDELGYNVEDLAKNSSFSVDYEKLARELGYDVNYIYHDGEVYVFSNYERGGMTYAKGGGIPNNYRGKTTDDIWNMLTENQRLHFLFDHREDFKVKTNQIPTIAQKNWNELSDDVKEEFKLHTMMGQYGKGGKVKVQDLSGEDNKTKVVDLSKYENIEGVDHIYKVGSKWYVDGYKMKHHTQGIGYTKKQALEDLDLHLSYVTENDEYADGGMMAKGGNVTSLEKKVAEVNALIEEGNKKGVEVIDSSSTWEAPMKYKPIKYSNGVLYIEYEELDLYSYNRGEGTKWKIKKDKVTKSGGLGVDDQKAELNYIARMYRKAIKHFDTYGYAEGGETDTNTFEKVKVTIKDVDMGGDVAYKGDHWFRKDQLAKKTNQEIGDFILRKYGLDYGNTYKYIIVRTGETKQKMGSGGVTFDDKVDSISKALLKRKKVSPSVQEDYGKTYSKREAIESAKRIAGAMRKKEASKKKS